MTVADACRHYGPVLDGKIAHLGESVTGARLLWVIAAVESSYGVRAEHVRAEPSYMPGGAYYKKSAALRQLYSRWGVLAAASLGAWQILYAAAWELGYRESPVRLQDTSICCAWATTYIQRRLIQRDGATTLAQIADGYNSGSSRDAYIPQDYVTKVVRAYEDGPTLLAV